MINGEDNISHFELIRNVDRNKGYLYEKSGSATEKTLNQSLVSYPQGLHLSGAVIRQSIDRFVKYSDIARYLTYYYVFICFIFALLAASIWLAFQTLLENSQIKRRPDFSAYSVALLTVLAFLGTYFLSLFSAGFQTHLISLSMFAALLAALTKATTSIDKEKRFWFVVSVLFVTAQSFLWLFLLPVAIVVFVSVFLLSYLSFSRLLGSFVDLFKNELKLVVVLLCIGSLSLIQIYAQYKYGDKSQINVQGYILPIPMLLLAGLATFSGVSIILMRGFRLKLAVALTLLSATGYFCLSALYQLKTIGELRYYSYKSSYTIFFLAAILLPLLAAYIIEALGEQNNRRLNPKVGQLFKAALVGGLGLFLLGTINPSNYSPWPNGTRYTSDRVIREVISEAVSGTEVLPIGQCIRSEDYLIARLSSVLSESTNNQWRQTYADILTTRGESFSSKLTEIKNIKPSNSKLLFISVDSNGAQVIKDEQGNLLDSSPLDYTYNVICTDRIVI